jgi:hypothetical protein
MAFETIRQRNYLYGRVHGSVNEEVRAKSRAKRSNKCVCVCAKANTGRMLMLAGARCQLRYANREHAQSHYRVRVT